MNLLDESFQSKEEKKGNATKTILLVAITLVILSIIGITILIAVLKEDTFTVVIDGKVRREITEDFFSIEKDEDGNDVIYVPIKKMADALGYKNHKGEYKNESEAINRCYIRTEQEVANFELGSNKIYKVDLTTGKEEYEYVYSKYPVKSKDAVLLASSEAIEKSFNISFFYDAKESTITIFTLPYLVQLYSQQILDHGYEEISEIFANQKALLKDMAVVKKDNFVGVIDTTNWEPILETKYEEIEYLPNVGNGTDFLVGSNGKVGVMSNSKNVNSGVKVKIAYNSISLLDIDAGFYLVQGNNNKYGIVDFNGKERIPVENDQIGVDISKFPENNIKNKYILAENIIPVKKDNKWALYDKSAKALTINPETNKVHYIYDDIGYVGSSNNNNYKNLLVIPEYNILVVKQGDRYYLISSLGENLLPNAIMDDIYMEISGNETMYWINANNEHYNIVDEVLGWIGINKKTKTSADNQANEETQNKETTTNEGETNGTQEDENPENENPENENTENEDTENEFIEVENQD